jgi:hypothetical protein
VFPIETAGVAENLGMDATTPEGRFGGAAVGAGRIIGGRAHRLSVRRGLVIISGMICKGWSQMRPATGDPGNDKGCSLGSKDVICNTLTRLL